MKATPDFYYAAENGCFSDFLAQNSWYSRHGSSMRPRKSYTRRFASLNGFESAHEEEKQPSSSYKLQGSHCKWSFVHSFYAILGGFAFDLDETDSQLLSLPAGRSHRLTVTPIGVLLLAECGLLPPVTAKNIEDKSKADGVAKALILLQAS